MADMFAHSFSGCRNCLDEGPNLGLQAANVSVMPHDICEEHQGTNHTTTLCVSDVTGVGDACLTLEMVRFSVNCVEDMLL